MGFTKKWIPASPPIPNDLGSWITICTEIHEGLLEAGLLPTGTEGQLDLGTVLAVPANNTYAGFIEYDFSDDLQSSAPIRIKLEFGAGAVGLAPGNFASNSRRGLVPFVRCTVYFNGTPSSVFACPQTTSHGPRGTQSNGVNGVSMLCYSEEQGFLGVVHGAGAHPLSPAGHRGGIIAAHFSLFIQRSTDAAGQPNSDSCTLYYSGFDVAADTASNYWTARNADAAYSEYITLAGQKQRSRRLALRLNGNTDSMLSGNVQTQHIYTAYPEPTPLPTLLSYATGVAGTADIPIGTEFLVETIPGQLSNFISLGNETCISVDELVGQRAGIAMLFE